MTQPEYFRLASYVGLFLLLVVSAYTDITRNKVYNWCTFPGMGLGMALAYLAGGFGSNPGEYNLLNSLVGMAAGGGIILLFSLFGGIGLGDVKLMAAVGALAGVPFVLSALLYSSMVGFAIAIGMLIWRGRLKEGLVRSARYAFRWKKTGAGETGPADAEAAGAAAAESPVLRRPSETIPFGAAIGFGTLWAFFLSVGG